MKKIIYIFLLAGVLFACKRDPIPKNAINRAKFVDILVDVHIAEGLDLEKERLDVDSLFNGASMYMSVLEKHGVTQDEMLITSLYYSRHQKEYKKIYTDVLDKLNIMIEELSMKQSLKIRTDSINTPGKKEFKTLE